MKKKMILLVSAVLLGLPLTACGGKTGTSSGTAGSSGSSGADTSSSAGASSSTAVTGANGVLSYATASYDERATITSKLEKYAIDNFVGGLPMFDDGGTVLYNSRLSIPSDTYLPQVGFGVAYGSTTADLSGETVDAYKRYFHTFEAELPETFNGTNSSEATPDDMMGYYALPYYDVKIKSDASGYEWYNVLAKQDPIALNADSTGMATKWRVKLHANEEGYVYNTLSTNAAVKAFNGTKIQLADYLTPYKLCLDNIWYRSSDLGAATYGFTGVAQYVLDLQLGKTPSWDSIGIQLNEAEGAIDFTFCAPKTPFYAKYNLANHYYSPIPSSYLEAIGGADKYGVVLDATNKISAVDTVLTVGPYTPELIDDSQMLFKKNDTSCVASLRHYAGYKEWIWGDTNTDATYAYNQYKAGKLDAVGVPHDYLTTEASNPECRHTIGTTSWALQLNTCTKAQWIQKFGTKGTVSKTAETDYWDVKPWMSNKNFLNGLYYALDRKTIADYRGCNPSQGLLGPGYLSDPINGVSYRSTAAGKSVLADRSPDTYGYSKSIAATYFKAAVSQLVASGDLTAGTAEKPTTLHVNVMFMTAAHKTTWGAIICQNFQDAFNGAFSDGSYKLVCDATNPAKSYYVYYYATMIGQFDICFAGITGSAMDPVNIMEIYKSNNSSGFTLSWGPDTNVNDGKSLVYDNKTWSFDALWAASDHVVLAKDGTDVNPLTIDDNSITTDVKDLAAGSTVALTGGFHTYTGDGASAEVTNVLLYDGDSTGTYQELGKSVVTGSNGAFTLSGTFTVPTKSGDGVFNGLAKYGMITTTVQIVYTKTVGSVVIAGNIATIYLTYNAVTGTTTSSSASQSKIADKASYLA